MDGQAPVPGVAEAALDMQHKGQADSGTAAQGEAAISRCSFLGLPDHSSVL